MRPTSITQVVWVNTLWHWLPFECFSRHFMNLQLRVYEVAQSNVVQWTFFFTVSTDWIFASEDTANHMNRHVRQKKLRQEPFLTGIPKYVEKSYVFFMFSKRSCCRIFCGGWMGIHLSDILTGSRKKTLISFSSYVGSFMRAQITISDTQLLRYMQSEKNFPSNLAHMTPSGRMVLYTLRCFSVIFETDMAPWCIEVTPRKKKGGTARFREYCTTNTK